MDVNYNKQEEDIQRKLSESSKVSDVAQNNTRINSLQQRRGQVSSYVTDTQIDGQKSAISTHQTVHDLNTNSKPFSTLQQQRENYPQISNFDTTHKQTSIGSVQITNDNNINQQNDNSKQDSIQIPKVLNRFSSFNLPETTTVRAFTSHNNNQNINVTRKPLNYYSYNSDFHVTQTTENVDLKQDEISTEIYNTKTKLRIEPIYHRNAYLTTTTEENTESAIVNIEKTKNNNVRNVVIEPNSNQGAQAQDNYFVQPKHFRQIVLSTTEPLKASLDNDAILSHVTKNPWTDFRNLISSTISSSRFTSNRLQEINIQSTTQPTQTTTRSLPIADKNSESLVRTTFRNNYHFDTSTQNPSIEKVIETSTLANMVNQNPNTEPEKSSRVRPNVKNSISNNKHAVSTNSPVSRSKPRPIVRQPAPFMTKKGSGEIVRDSQESESITQLRRKPFLFDEKPFSNDGNKQNQKNFVTDSTLLVNSRRAFKEVLNKTRDVQRTTVSPYKSLETIRTTFDDKSFGFVSDIESITKGLVLDEPKHHFDDTPIDIPTTFRPNIKFILTSEANNFDDKDLVLGTKTQQQIILKQKSPLPPANEPAIEDFPGQLRGRYSLPIKDHSATTEEIWREPPFKSRFSFSPKNSKLTAHFTTETPTSSTENSITSTPENKLIYEIPGGILINKNSKERGDGNENKNSGNVHFNINNRGYIKHKYFLENYESSTASPHISTHPPYKQKFRATVEVPSEKDLVSRSQTESATEIPIKATTKYQSEINNEQNIKATITTFRPHVNDQKPINITNSTKIDNTRAKHNSRHHTTKRPMTDEERFKMEYEQIRSDLTHASRHHANLGRPKFGGSDSKSGYRRTEPIFRRDQASTFNEGSIIKLRTDFVKSKINSQRDKNILGKLRPSPTEDSSEQDVIERTTAKATEIPINYKFIQNDRQKFHSVPTKSGFITSKNNFDDKLEKPAKLDLEEETETEHKEFDEIKAYIDQLNFDEPSTEVIIREENPRYKDHTKIYLRPKITNTNKVQINSETETDNLQQEDKIYSPGALNQTGLYLEQNHEPTPTIYSDHTKLYIYENQTNLEQQPKDLIATYVQQNITNYNQQVSKDDQKVYDVDTDLGILKTLNQKPVLIPAIPSRASRVNADIRQMINSRNRDQNHSKEPIRCSKDNASTRCNEVIAVSSATPRYKQTDKIYRRNFENSPCYSKFCCIN